MPTVLAAKFEDLVAIGLRSLISDDPHLELVAADVSMESIERVIERHRPDVALLNFGTLGSPARVLQLHQAYPGTHIVLLANRPTAAECNQLLSFGATACISKETEGRDIINAIHLASRGMHLLPRSAATTGLGHPPLHGAELLTPREGQVLERLRDGASNAEIAHELSIGIETVRTHARNIYRKLGIGSRRELERDRQPLGTA
jgi:DNA-binding NarL/FixJ family response regulator